VSARRAKVAWWLPGRSWANDGWRWRVASAVDKLRGQCWPSLVDWALRRHEDDPDTPLRDLVRRVPFRRQDEVCRSDRDRNGTCYCGKLRTPEADAQMRAAADAAEAGS
jgi:hypothetical protein